MEKKMRNTELKRWFALVFTGLAYVLITISQAAAASG
jgi:hypothetical protein